MPTSVRRRMSKARIESADVNWEAPLDAGAPAHVYAMQPPGPGKRWAWGRVPRRARKSRRSQNGWPALRDRSALASDGCCIHRRRLRLVMATA